MGALVFVGLVALTAVIVAPILALIAYNRSGRHERTIFELQGALRDAAERIAGLERVVTQLRRPTPAPTAGTDAAVVKPAAVPPLPIVAEQTPTIVAPGTPSEPVEPQPITALPPAPPQAPVLQPEPEPVVTTTNPLIAWLVGGNPIAKLGVLLLFFGLAYLLKFASDRGLLPIQVRLSGAAVIAIGLLVVGWRMRDRRPAYALTLQGGAVGALYLTSFAAFRVYSLLPYGLVFSLLAIICAASVALAVLQRAQSLALLASLGGYMAPILLSTGGGNQVATFTYYAILSTGILAVSVWQAWRPLNLVGFAFTFGVGTLWGVNSYNPAFYASSQFFLALNLLIYGVLAVLMALRHSGTSTDLYIDGTLAFGTPLIGFGLQVGLTRQWEYGPALSALAFGAVYIPLAFATHRRWPEHGRRLTMVFLALGSGFATLAIPLALSARWTAVAWALEGLGIVWVGRAQRNMRTAAAGTAILFLAAGSAARAWEQGMDTPTFVMVMAAIALTWHAAAWLWRESTDDVSPKALSSLLLGGGVIAWLVLLVGASNRFTETDQQVLAAGLTAMTATSLLWSAIGRRLAWNALESCAALLWPATAVVLLVALVSWTHPLATVWLASAFVLSLAAARWLLRSTRGATGVWPAGLHATHWWLVFGVVTPEVWYRVNRLGWGSTEWVHAVLLATCALFLLVFAILHRRRYWPFQQYPRAHWIAALLPALVVGVVLLVKSNLLDGRMPGRPYIPLLNPIEEAATFALLMTAVWRRRVAAIAQSDVQPLAAVSWGMVVWWGNGVLLRTLASVGGVAWTLTALWASPFIQTSMAIAWTIAALICMALAARTGHRQTWFAGAVSLGIVVVKLFLVDSARTGGLARAIAFIGVALLILAIGYLAPLPPRTSANGEVA